MASNISRYQRHIERLASQMGVVVNQYSPTTSGMMYVEYQPPMIEGPQITKGDEQRAYLVMLHELGHCNWGHTQGRPPYNDQRFYFENGVLRSEAQAWEFALDNMVGKLKPQLGRFLRNNYIGSYLRSSLWAGNRPNQTLGNGNRHYVKFTYDKPDEYFWRIWDRLYSDGYYPGRNKN